MGKIDLSKSLVGELYPVTADIIQWGSLGFYYPQPGDKSYIPPKQDDGTLISDPWTTGSNPTVPFKWRITPILNNKVLISCTHPLTGRNQLAYWLTEQEKWFFLEERDIPASEEAVKPKNQFEIEYIEGSPLFFSIKTANERYLTASDHAYSIINGCKYYSVVLMFDPSRKISGMQNYYNWFMAIDNAETGANAFAGFSNIKPFDQLSQKVGVRIDDSYLKWLTVI